MSFIRKGLLAAFLVALVALLALPVFVGANPVEEDPTAQAPVAVYRINWSSGVRDEAAMVLVGGALIALASVVRRAA